MPLCLAGYINSVGSQKCNVTAKDTVECVGEFYFCKKNCILHLKKNSSIYSDSGFIDL
jgi:hypothetical protein